MIGNLKNLAFDADSWRSWDALAHDVSFPDANCQAVFLASIGKPVDNVLTPFLRVRDQGRVVSKQHFSEEDSLDLGLCLQLGHTEQFPVTPGVRVDPLFGVLKIEVER